MIHFSIVLFFYYCFLFLNCVLYSCKLGLRCKVLVIALEIHSEWNQGPVTPFLAFLELGPASARPGAPHQLTPVDCPELSRHLHHAP